MRLAQPLLLRQRGEQLRLLTLDARALLALDHHDLLELRVPLLERREPLRELDDLRGPPRFEPDRNLRAAILGGGIPNAPLARPFAPLSGRFVHLKATSCTLNPKLRTRFARASASAAQAGGFSEMQLTLTTFWTCCARLANLRQ